MGRLKAFLIAAELSVFVCLVVVLGLVWVLD